MTPSSQARLRRPWIVAFGCIATGLLGRSLLGFPAAVEWHRETLFPLVCAALQAFFGSTVYSVGEILAIVVIGLALVALGRSPQRAVPRVLTIGGLAVFFFYATWGLAYRYPPLSDHLSALSASGEAPEYLVSTFELSARLVAELTPKSLSSGSDLELLGRVNAALTKGFEALPLSLEASPIRAIDFGPARFSRVSFALTRLQLSGYYFPWTGEAHINQQMPRSAWARVAGHERAHQRGFARENEATVMGVLACLGSSDPPVRYSGALGLFIALDRDVARGDAGARKRLWDLLPARALSDLREEEAFWKAQEGAMARVSEKVNDTYLKAQGVRSGVVSYSETTRLFLQALQTGSLSASAFKDLR